MQGEEMNADQTSEEERAEIMDVIRNRLYRYETEQLKEIALIIGRSYSCLIAIRSGRSQWPRANTLFPLAKSLGLRLTLVERQETEYVKKTKVKVTHFHDGSDRSLQ